MKDVLAIGAATRDVFLRSKAIRIVRDDAFSTGEAECFALGSKIEVDDIVFETGGGGTNTAVSFARQGLDSGFVGKIGAHDARGKEILAALREEGVDTNRVIRDPKEMTGYSVLLLTPRGERTALVYRGASADVRPADIRRLNLKARWLYITSLGGRLDTLRLIWRRARAAKTQIAWNPGAGELAHGLSALKPLMKQASMFTVNQEEAATLLGYTRHQDIGVFHQLRQCVGGITVVTQGTEGALAGQNEQAWHAATRPIKVTSTTGAGDAFGSGFIGELIRTNNIPRALQFGYANSESVIQHLSAKRGLIRGHRLPRPVTVQAL